MIWLVLGAAAVGAGWLLGTGDLAANHAAAAALGPRAGLEALLGAAVGLCARDRIRLRRAHASPSLAWLGKRLLLASCAAAATFAGSPVAWPPGAFEACAAAAGAGLAVWIGNLPPRL